MCWGMYILIYSIYVLFVKMVCGEFCFKRELMFCFYNVNLKTNSSCLIETICLNINLFYISYDELLHWGITWFYGDVSDVVLWAPLWTDLFRGRVEGWILYPRRGWCDWRFNHDGWVKWGCHDIATCLPRPTPVSSIKVIFSCFIIFINTMYVVCFLYLYIYMYLYMFDFGKTLVDFCLVLARWAWEGRPTREKCFKKEI